MGEIQTLAEEAGWVYKNGGKKILVLFCYMSNLGDAQLSGANVLCLESHCLFICVVFLESLLGVRHHVKLYREQYKTWSFNET